MVPRYNYVIILFAIKIGFAEENSYLLKSNGRKFHEEQLNDYKELAALRTEEIERAKEINKHEIINIEKSILNKIEEFIDEKFDTLEKRIYRKIDALEKMVPDKTDADVIIHKLDTLKKMQLDLDGNTVCTLANETIRNKKLIPDIEENINRKLNALDKKITQLFEIHMNITLNAMEKKESQNCNYNVLRSKPAESIEDYVNTKLDTMYKKISYFEQNMNRKLEVIQQKFPALEQSINSSIDVLQELEKNLLIEVYETQYSLGCKMQGVRGNIYVSPFFHMDNETFKYIKLRTDANGLAYFEMHLAVKATQWAHILLSPEPSGFDIYNEVAFEIGIHWDTLKLRRMKKEVWAKNMTNILSPTLYTAYYIKINNGTLQFGKEGSIGPLVTYADDLLRTMKYFSFGAWEHGEARFFYDCPTDEFLLLFEEHYDRTRTIKV